jgi:hypothetical protein
MIDPFYQCTCDTFPTAFQPSGGPLTDSVQTHIILLDGNNETGNLQNSAYGTFRNTLQFNRLRTKTDGAAFNSTLKPIAMTGSATLWVINNLTAGCGYPAGNRPIMVAAREKTRYARSRRCIPSDAARARSDS